MTRPLNTPDHTFPNNYETQPAEPTNNNTMGTTGIEAAQGGITLLFWFIIIGGFILGSPLGNRIQQALYEVRKAREMQWRRRERDRKYRVQVAQGYETLILHHMPKSSCLYDEMPPEQWPEYFEKGRVQLREKINRECGLNPNELAWDEHDNHKHVPNLTNVMHSSEKEKRIKKAGCTWGCKM